MAPFHLSLQSPECYSPCRGLPLPVTARKTSKPHYFLALIARALTGHLNWISRHSSPSSLRVMGESTQKGMGQGTQKKKGTHMGQGTQKRTVRARRCKLHSWVQSVSHPLR